MSVGEVGYLCLADLYDALGDRFDGMTLVHAGELMPYAGGLLGHSGAGDLFIYLFADRDSSWLYLTNGKGELLPRSESGPLPWSFYWETGSKWETSTYQPRLLAETVELDAHESDTP